MIRTRTKIEAVLAVAFLLAISISSVFAVTRTISDTSDTVYTRITCSNGNVYEATAANLQIAINSLSNQSGWVDGGMNNISISTTIKLGTKCELRNVKLWLANNADCTMIMNYNIATGNDGIKIHDVTLEGNGLNQPHQNSSFLMYDQPCGIYLIKSNNASIHHVTVNNTQFTAITIQQGRHAIIDNVKIFKVGYWISLLGYTPGDCYSAGGIFIYNSTDSIVSTFIINNTWATGIGVESTLPSLLKYRCPRVELSNGEVTYTTIGYFFEDVGNVTVTNCLADNLKLKNTAFSLPCGFYAKEITTKYITLIGCTVSGITQTSAYAIALGGDNSTIIGCKMSGITRGIYVRGNDSIISDNIIYAPSILGISVSGCKRVSISGNHIYGGCGYGYGIILTNTKNVSLSTNYITQSALHYPDYGIYESGTTDGTRIDVSNDVYVLNARYRLIGTHSFALIVDAIGKKIGVNTSTGITWIS